MKKSLERIKKEVIQVLRDLRNELKNNRMSKRIYNIHPTLEKSVEVQTKHKS